LYAAGILLLGVAISAPPCTAQNSHSSADWARLSAAKSLGNPNAPIKVEVFSDYECPACGRFYEGTLRPMIDDYVASGKVYLVHRDFPLPLHKYSREAARWANAASRIGYFEPVDRVLYDNQAVWGEHGSADGDIKKFVQAALPSTEFRRVERLMQGCESDSHAEIAGCAVDAGIQHDMAAAQLLPVTQTPTFVVSSRGQSYPPAAGVISWPLMKQFLDQILRRR
jgi:protein-disulfide isomerase